MIGSARLLRSYGLTHGLIFMEGIDGIDAQPPKKLNITRIKTNFIFMSRPLEEQRQSAGELDVVLRLLGSQQIGFEYVVAYIDVESQPIGCDKTVA